MTNNNNIPKHWQLKKLGEVCKITLGQSPPSNTYNKIGAGLPFFQGKAEFSDIHPIVDKWCFKPNKIADVNDILLSVRAPVGATNIADTKCCIGRGLAAIRFENYKYIYYYLKSIEKYLDTKGTGTTFKAISGETLRNVLMPVPPSIEQQAIVTKLEEVLSELENGKQQLVSAQEQLKVYRRSLLKSAFEGKLTKNKGKWRKIKLGEVANAVDPQPSHRTPPIVPNGIPYVSIKDFDSELDKIDLESARKVSPDVLTEHLNRYRLQKGDFVIGKIGTIASKL
jgi:restriction endonuclease S subunit